MKKIDLDRVKTLEDFQDDKYLYIEYLEKNELITHGCALCMSGYYPCEEAVRKYREDDFVFDIPFGNLEVEEQFPISCLREWYGEEYVEEVRERQKYF